MAMMVDEESATVVSVHGDDGLEIVQLTTHTLTVNDMDMDVGVTMNAEPSNGLSKQGSSLVMCGLPTCLGDSHFALPYLQFIRCEV